MSEKDLSHITKELNKIKDRLIELGEKNGTNARVRDMKAEITSIGWVGILEKYHPENNLEDPAAHELFQMYKYIFFKMREDKEI